MERCKLKRVLSGIQPSGKLHIGNYFGSISQLTKAQENSEVFAFIANYHAQTSLQDGELLKGYTLQTAIDFLSLGIDPSKTHFWVQSDVPAVLELYWFLSSFTSMGLLQRAHSYKDKVAKGIAPNHSLFSYPVLMAADILLYDSEVVPVGKDQIQHIEMTRDIALRVNQFLDEEFFVVPEYKVEENLAVIPGVDGAKMSKSYDNTIEIFCDEKELKKRVSKIVTDSTPMEDPKEYEACNVYNIAKHFLTSEQTLALQERYTKGGEGYGHFKAYLKEVILEHFAPYREKRAYYQAHTDEVRDILQMGAKKVSAVASVKMAKLQDKLGTAY